MESAEAGPAGAGDATPRMTQPPRREQEQIGEGGEVADDASDGRPCSDVGARVLAPWREESAEAAPAGAGDATPGMTQPPRREEGKSEE